MLHMRIESFVDRAVRHALLGQGREKEALYFHFDLRMAHYLPDGGRHSAARGLHLLYHLNPDSSYVSVFSAVRGSPFERITAVEEWKHETSHDSVWRDIRVFSQVYFDMAKEINELRVSDGFPEIAPAAMTEHNGFRLLGDKLYEWVPAEVTKDPTDPNNYRKVITLL